MEQTATLRPMIEAALAQPWYRLWLEPPLEAAFLSAMAPLRLRTMRSDLLILSTMGALLLWTDMRAGPQLFHLSLILRLAIGLPVGIAAVWLVGWLRDVRWQTAVFGTVIIAFVCGAAVLAHYGMGMGGSRHLMIGGLIVFSTNVVVPLRLRHAIVFSAAAIACYLAASLLPFGPYDPGNRDLIAFTVLLMLLSVRVRWRIESDQIRSVLLGLLDAQHVLELARANAKLHELSHTDPLTGVANRRWFDETMHAAWRDAESTGAPLGLLMLDVDDFKKFNDAAGHAEGDNCLRLVASALRQHVRPGLDVVARYGGEEFIALLPDATPEDAAGIAERVRQAIEVMCLPHPGQPGRMAVVTVSVGVAAWRPGRDAADPGRLIAAADAALYLAKAGGRNRVALAQAPLCAHG